MVVSLVNSQISKIDDLEISGTLPWPESQTQAKTSSYLEHLVIKDPNKMPKYKLILVRTSQFLSGSIARANIGI